MLLPWMNNDAEIEVGLDEVGRGPGFGRLYTAAVIWPKDLVVAPLVMDSKKIKSSLKMQQAYDFIVENAVDWYVDYATVEEVNDHGPLKADMISMHRALQGLKLVPDHILVDGNYFKPTYKDIATTTVKSGDAKYFSIAAASILAKWSRDQHIKELCLMYPLLDTRYGISNNKGYLTTRHIQGIEDHGITEFHRHKYKRCAGFPLNIIAQVPTMPTMPTMPTKISVKIMLKSSTY